MLSLAKPSKNLRHEDATGVQVTLVAGARYQRDFPIGPVKI
jgi:hypothetical protein